MTEERVKNAESLYLVMPAYNEEANIKTVVDDWYKMLEGKADSSRLVVADSGSSDRTHEILLKLQESYPQLIILSDTQKQHGPKVIALYKYAIDNNIDFIFQTDSDGQTNPDEFQNFWDMREEYDVVLGNRTIRGDGRSRAFVEKVVCLLLKLYFGVNSPDANAPFRLMRTSVVNKYLSKLPVDYALPNIMLTAYFLFNHEKCRFVEVSFKPRQGGNNSIDLRKIIRIGCKALGDFRRFKKDMMVEE